MKSNKGFTLIELVVVIVILGILAATALPKFVDLGKDARIAKVNAMAGTLRSAAAQGRSICVLNPSSCSLTGGGSFLYQGKTFSFYLGYPEAGGALNSGEIDSLVETSGFVVSLTADTQHTRFTPTDAADPSGCYADYRQALLSTDKNITISTETSTC